MIQGPRNSRSYRRSLLIQNRGPVARVGTGELLLGLTGQVKHVLSYKRLRGLPVSGLVKGCQAKIPNGFQHLVPRICASPHSLDHAEVYKLADRIEGRG